MSPEDPQFDSLHPENPASRLEYRLEHTPTPGVVEVEFDVNFGECAQTWRARVEAIRHPDQTIEDAWLSAEQRAEALVEIASRIVCITLPVKDWLERLSGAFPNRSFPIAKKLSTHRPEAKMLLASVGWDRAGVRSLQRWGKVPTGPNPPSSFGGNPFGSGGGRDKYSADTGFVYSYIDGNSNLSTKISKAERTRTVETFQSLQLLQSDDGNYFCYLRDDELVNKHWMAVYKPGADGCGPMLEVRTGLFEEPESYSAGVKRDVSDGHACVTPFSIDAYVNNGERFGAPEVAP